MAPATRGKYARFFFFATPRYLRPLTGRVAAPTVNIALPSRTGDSPLLSSSDVASDIFYPSTPTGSDAHLVRGYDAGIHPEPNVDSLAAWQPRPSSSGRKVSAGGRTDARTSTQ